MITANGAVEGDPQAATGAAMASRRRNSTNDVGWRIWEGNYGNGLVTQLAPAETSVGWWRVGPTDQPFGRFARGLEHSTGRTELSFVLNKELWGGLPLTPTTAPAAGLTLLVTYLDRNGPSGFDILYDAPSAGGGCAAHSVSVGNTDRWITVHLNVSNAVFAKGCASKGGQADIVLRSTAAVTGQGTAAGADVVFHGLEVVRS